MKERSIRHDQPDAKVLVRMRLRDPDSAEFSGMAVHEGSGTASPVVCGYVNSRNGFGGMSGLQMFIAGDNVLLEEQVPADEMATAWLNSCL